MLKGNFQQEIIKQMVITKQKKQWIVLLDLGRTGGTRAKDATLGPRIGEYAHFGGAEWPRRRGGAKTAALDPWHVNRGRGWRWCARWWRRGRIRIVRRAGIIARARARSLDEGAARIAAGVRIVAGAGTGACARDLDKRVRVVAGATVWVTRVKRTRLFGRSALVRAGIFIART